MAIPNHLQLIWTGPHMPSQQHLQEVVQLSARGVSPEAASKRAGLSINLWVDNINKFEHFYQKSRCFTSPSAGDLSALPQNPNITLKSIGDLETHSPAQKILWHFLNTDRTISRNKGNSASDIARVMILHQEGGVYADLRLATSTTKKLALSTSKSMDTNPRLATLTTEKFAPIPSTNKNFICPLNLFHTWVAVSNSNSLESLIMLEELAHRLLASTMLPKHKGGVMSASTRRQTQALKTKYESEHLPHPLQVAINKKLLSKLIKLKLRTLFSCTHSSDTLPDTLTDKPYSRYDHERHPNITSQTYSYPYGEEFIDNDTNPVYVLERTGNIFSDMKPYQRHGGFAISDDREASQIISEIFRGRPNNTSYALWAKNKPSSQSMDTARLPDWQLQTAQ
ncbi:MAG: hypothetical protein P8176_12225 [Gammaproteobacteria bacterium]